MIHFILALWASYIVLGCFDKDDYIKIAKVICVSSVLISSVGILQILGLSIFGKIAWFTIGDKAFTAFLDNPWVAGGYLALSLPFFLLFKDKKYLFGLLLASLGVILSKSAMALICGGIGLFTYLLFIVRNNKKIFYSLISLFGLVIIFCILNFKLLIPEFSGRFGLWKLALIKFKENPIFGQGLGIVKSWRLNYNTETWLVLHNDWFELAIQIGVVGIVLLLSVIINSLRKFNYKNDNRIGYVYYASFISFLVLMAGAFPLEIAPLALFGLINFCGVETL